MGSLKMIEDLAEFCFIKLLAGAAGVSAIEPHKMISGKNYINPKSERGGEKVLKKY
jgi:hypothetical protein